MLSDDPRVLSLFSGFSGLVEETCFQTLGHNTRRRKGKIEAEELIVARQTEQEGGDRESKSTCQLLSPLVL